MPYQIANSFDEATMKKIVKGLGYSFLGGLSAALMQYQATGDVKGAIITGLITMLVPFSTNAGVQYKKGA